MILNIFAKSRIENGTAEISSQSHKAKTEMISSGSEEIGFKIFEDFSRLSK